jgi:hypothetical protein
MIFIIILLGAIVVLLWTMLEVIAGQAADAEWQHHCRDDYEDDYLNY